MRRFIAAFAAVSLLLTGCSGEEISGRIIDRMVEAERSAAQQEALPPASLPPEAEEEALSGELNEEEVYRILCRELRNCNTHIHIEGAVTKEWIEHANTRIVRERPDLDMFTGLNYAIGADSTDVTYHIIEDMTEDDLRRMYAEVKTEVDHIAAEALRRPDDYSRVLYVHDYIVTHTEYNEAFSGKVLGTANTAYGCLVQGRAVCQGYASAFQLIMQRMEIPVGSYSGPAGDGNHVWNTVEIAGKPYWIDVTWDDPVGQAPDDVSHDHFLMNDDLLLRTRDYPRENDRPRCTDLTYNYFIQNGCYLTEYSFAEVDRLLKQAKDGRLEIMFADRAGFDAAVQELFEEERIWETATFCMGGSFSYRKNENMLVLKILID